MTQLTALELVDVLIGRVRGTEFENLAREIRTALCDERSPAPMPADPVRATFEIAAVACGLPAGVDLSRRILKGAAFARVHRARHIAMYLLYHDVGLSTPRIAKIFGLRDHTTVIYGRDRIEEKMRDDERFRLHVNQLREPLGGPRFTEVTTA